MELAYDDATTARSKAFQRAKGLTEDGVVGAKTWALLLEVTPASATVDTATAPGLPDMPTLLALAEHGGSEQSLLAYLSEDAGVDIGALLRDLDESLRSQPEVTA
jgi:peptidoglycan hydrolase-like protein with peptidoglycan-binding domain